jgi:hypothetical protein
MSTSIIRARFAGPRAGANRVARRCARLMSVVLVAGLGVDDAHASVDGQTVHGHMRVTAKGAAIGCVGDAVFGDGFEDSASRHPLYPPLDLATLPGSGGAASGPYQSPALPCTSRTVAVAASGSAAGLQLQNECAIAGSAVQVPSTAGRIGVINLGNVEDCDITLGSAVVIDFLVVGSLPGPTHAPSHRIRIRGGQIGSMLAIGPSSDIVLDGVAINNGAVPSASRSGTGIYLPAGPAPSDVLDRFALVNSMVRMVAVASGNEFDGQAQLSARARNLLFANNNIVTAGNRNSWGFRISGGDNVLIVDNTVRVSFHKLVRMNDAPVDYLYIKGGTWMRQATLTSGGQMPNDSFAQLSGSTTDRVYIHDPIVYLLADTPVSFGASIEAAQAGRSWHARGIAWHARDSSVISAARMQSLQDLCTGSGGLCDYDAASHSYTADPALSFPPNPWRNLPGFADDNPDSLPLEP